MNSAVQTELMVILKYAATQTTFYENVFNLSTYIILQKPFANATTIYIIIKWM